MNRTRGEKSGTFRYKNFLLSILDMWQLLNQDIPKKIEDSKIREEIREERERKLGSRASLKAEIFSSTEISIIGELVSDPRKSFVKISSNLGLSRHTVKKRIQDMLKQEKINFYLGINYLKLNVDIVILTLQVVNLKFLDELFQEFQVCPRIFSLIKDISKSSLQVFFAVEKDSQNVSNQCVNIIEKFQLDARVKECTVTSLYSEIFPLFILFGSHNLPKKGSLSSCEVNCALCEKFINQKCVGCPASNVYKGTIFNLE